ncbi:Sec-independent protein translocase protein (TatC) [Pycnococcus provasolii]
MATRTTARVLASMASLISRTSWVPVRSLASSARPQPLVERTTVYTELTTRGRYAAASGALALVTGFVCAPGLVQAIAHPLASIPAFADATNPRELICTDMTEALHGKWTAAVGTALLCWSPYAAYQGIAFALPGLTVVERGGLLRAAAATVLTSASGVVLSYQHGLPYAWNLLVGFEDPSAATPVVVEARLLPYVKLASTLVGLGAFVPAALVAGAYALGTSTSPQAIARFAGARRFAYGGWLLAAAALAPPDPATQLSLTLLGFGAFEAVLFGGSLGRAYGARTRFRALSSERRRIRMEQREP